MANKFKVTDTEFNRVNYPDIIGETFDSPPAYANVELIKDITSMDDIFEAQSKWSREEVDESEIINFIIKSLRTGHEQLPIIQSVKKYFRRSESEAQQLFTKAVVKMKNIKLPKDTKDIKHASGSNWYKEAQINSNNYSIPITPSIYMDSGEGVNYDIISEPANIPFNVDVDARSWGIKDVSIYASETIVVGYTLNIWGDEEDLEVEKTVMVDLSKLPTEDTHYGHGSYTVTELELYLDSNGEVNYEKSNIVFSKG